MYCGLSARKSWRDEHQDRPDHPVLYERERQDFLSRNTSALLVRTFANGGYINQDQPSAIGTFVGRH